MLDENSVDLCLDVRSYEQVIVLDDQGSSNRPYPDHWIRSQDFDFSGVDNTAVVIIDRISLSRAQIEKLSHCAPRLAAFIPMDVDSERRIRSSLKQIFPWGDSWTVNSKIGKMIITDFRGRR